MYRKTSSKWLKHLDFMIMDCLCLEFSFFLAYFIRHKVNSPLENSLYRNMIVFFLLINVVIIYFNESFKNVLKRGFYKEFSMTIKHTFLLLALSTLYLVFTQQGNAFSRITLGFTFAIYALTTYCIRICWKKVILKKATVQKLSGNRSLVIITNGNMLDTAVSNILNHNYERFVLSGICVIDEDREGEIIQDIPIVANRSNVLEYVCREWVDEVLINLSHDAPICDDLINNFIEMGITVHLKLLKTASFNGQKQFIEKLGNYTVLTTTINTATNRQLFFKRSVDIVGGIVGCLFTLALTVIIAPFIYIQDPGTIFYRQVRIGKNGRKFNMIKFRSMYKNADERKAELMERNKIKDGMMFKLEHDPRIIGGKKGIGQFIRKTSLDEFPQFWNVLKGEMSLVGTRPPTIDEWEKYDLHHRARLAIKPGITGLWQVSGRSDIIDFEEVVRLDTEYITTWSMGLDFKILLKTVSVVLGKKGSM